MSNNNLKASTISGIFWKLCERIGAQLVSFVVSVILARLLTPDDYSVVGIVTIFFAFANTLISGGFNAALIQKKDADIGDYSSVLWLSILSSTVMYGIIFFSAPAIAELYDKAILIPVFRVMGLTFLINGYKSILCAYVSSHLQFKKLFFSTLIGTITSAIVGISLAFLEFGPWALVAQQMTNAVIDTVFLAITTRVRFNFKISLKRIVPLFRYGWKIWVASFINTAYDEINPLIIGIRFSGADLSFYTKGRSFPNLINSSLSSTVSAVLFPVMAKLQDDKNALLNYTRRFMRISSFLIFPAMMGFFAVSDSFVYVLLGQNWVPAVPYVQAFCIVYMFNMVQTGNLQVIRAIGRSDIYLVLEIIKKTAYAIVILLFCLFTHKPIYLAIACIVNTCIATLVNTFPNRKLIGYNYRLQIADLLPALLTSVVMSIAVYTIRFFNIDTILLLVLQIIAGVLIYFSLNYIIKNPDLVYLLNTIKEILHKRRKNK